MTQSAIVAAFPLTALQEGMLYHTMRTPDAGLFHVQCQVALEGQLEREHFCRAWEVAVARHPALRTFFSWEGRERPLQVVRTTAAVALECLDWTELSPAAAELRWEDLLRQDRARPLDLSRAPLMRLQLVRLGAQRHRLLWSMHHAILDGWSGHLILEELVRDYTELAGGRAPSVVEATRFDQLVGWLEAQDSAGAEAHWRSVLAGWTAPTPLPGGLTGRPGGSDRRHATERLTRELTFALPAIAARLGVTINTLLMGAWAMMLARYADQDGVMIGVTATDRPRSLPGVERAAGLYLSTVPVQAPPQRGATVIEWLRELQLGFSDALAHGAPGLAAIRRWTGQPTGSPLFDNLVVFEHFPPSAVRPPLAPGGLAVSSMVAGVPNDVPLVLLAHPGERLLLDIVYDPDVVPEAVANRLPRFLATVLGAFGGGPDAVIDALPLEDADERRQLLEHWSGAAVPAPAAPDWVDRFEQLAVSRAGDPALQTEHESVTYGELDRHANRLAQRLVAEGLGPESMVGVLAERFPGAIAGVVACLKAGAAFALLDPAAPSSRMASCVAAMDLLLVSPALEGRVPAGTRSLPLDAAVSSAGTPPPRSPSATDAAYVVFTSGSSGEPKGVVVERGQLAASNAARDAYYPEPPSAFLLLSPLSVDSALAGIFWTLGTGGALVLPPPHGEQDIEALGRLVAQRGVSHTLLVPSLYRTLLELADPRQLRGLRCVIVAGEACSADTVALHRSQLPWVALHNEYGPSEATIWATAAELAGPGSIAPGGPTVTIGRPVPGAWVYLLDQTMRPVPTGCVGEIWIGGAMVARGYLNQPEETQQRFGVDPFHSGGRLYRTGDRGRFLEDGRLEFLGRADEQLKVRGFRIEPADIERALVEHPAVREAVVALVPRPVPAEPDALVAALAGLPADAADRLLRAVEDRP